MRLGGFEKRRPRELSGGQQQRVASGARAHPATVGAAARRAARRARRQAAQGAAAGAGRLQDEVGITFVYVTHDQEEALTMSDRLAVMDGGQHRSGRHPGAGVRATGDAYVADFLGVANLLDVECTGSPGEGCVRYDSGSFDLAHRAIPSNGPVRLVIRPERVRVRAATEADEDNCVPARSNESSTSAPSPRCYLRLADRGRCRRWSPTRRSDGRPEGTPVVVALPVDGCAR